MQYTKWQIGWRGLAVALLMAMTGAAAAHGEGKTQPADGAALETPPETITVRFDEPTRVTSFEVTGPDGPVALASEPATEATERVQVAPSETLGAGDYTVEWRALGSDGHPFAGSMSFKVTE